MLRVTVVKAELGPEPGVSLGSSSKFSHKNGQRKKLRKGYSVHLYQLPLCSLSQAQIGPCPQHQHAQKQREGGVSGLARGHSVLGERHCSVPRLV